MTVETLPAVDLSKDQDDLLEIPEFSETYFAALSRSVKIKQRISDEAIADHNPALLAELLTEDLQLHGFTSDEIRQVAMTLNSGLE